MTRLNLSDNSTGGHDDEPGVHALADMLKNNTTLKEINISSNSLGEECAQILAPAIKDNGAMTSLNASNNSLGIAAGWAFSSGQWWLKGNYPPGHSGTNPCSQLPAAGSEVSGVILLTDV
jgi:hypothetical protein